MVTLVRSASLSNYLEVTRSLGLNPLPLLHDVGISASDLANPDTRIPLEACVKLLDNTAGEAGVEDLGLRMAEKRRLSNLGPLALLAYVETTVREALFALVRYLPLQTDAMSIKIEESRGIAIISEEHKRVRHFVNRHGVELSMGVLYRTLREFLGDTAWRPRSVCFTHGAPRDLSTHQRLFGAPVDFDSDMDALVCRSSDLDRPIPTADPVTTAHLHRFLSAIANPVDADLATQVQQLITAQLPTGCCSAETVARQLGLPPSSFFRKMAQQERSYADILNEVRREFAMRYISNPQRPLTEVSSLLGFSGLSAFSRWFKQQYGCSPSNWTESHSP